MHYLADMLREHFGDGSEWNVQIDYVEEDEPLGTAGAIGLLPEFDQPMIMMNGDLLTHLSFQRLLDYHESEGADMTLCVRQYDYEVPFGVVEIENSRVTSIVEKPVQDFYVNAGVYVLSPNACCFVGEEETIDMPQLVERLIAKDLTVVSYPIYEYWMDLGRPDDLEQAREDITSD